MAAKTPRELHQEIRALKNSLRTEAQTRIRLQSDNGTLMQSITVLNRSLLILDQQLKQIMDNPRKEVEAAVAQTQAERALLARCAIIIPQMVRSNALLRSAGQKADEYFGLSPEDAIELIEVMKKLQTT